MSDLPLVAGVELGGTKCVCLLASGPDGIEDEARIPTTTPEETLGAVRSVLERWAKKPGFAGLGLATFGPVELDPTRPDHGRIVNTPKPGWNGADVMGLAEGLGVPFQFDTDVNGAALAEGHDGARPRGSAPGPMSRSEPASASAPLSASDRYRASAIPRRATCACRVSPAILGPAPVPITATASRA